jgi:hypothetical protein
MLHAGNNRTSPPFRLHSDILRLSSPYFLNPQRQQLPWSEDVTQALAQFMYTGSVVVPTALLSQVRTKVLGSNPACVCTCISNRYVEPVTQALA